MAIKIQGTTIINDDADNNPNLGVGALANITTGTNNTAVGSGAGSTITSGSNLTTLGYDAEPSSATATNEITLGNASVTRFRVPGLSYDTTNGPIGHANIPPVGTKTSSYTLAKSDVGKYVQVGSGGSITIPNSIFSEGDVVSVFNNTSGDITITTAYISGTDSDVASVTLATRGIATILFISGTVCVIAGNVS